MNEEEKKWKRVGRGQLIGRPTREEEVTGEECQPFLSRALHTRQYSPQQQILIFLLIQFRLVCYGLGKHLLSPIISLRLVAEACMSPARIHVRDRILGLMRARDCFGNGIRQGDAGL